jgi:transposase InsO family protein
MTKTNKDLAELLAKHDQGDLVRSIDEAVLQLIIETDVDGLIGAGRHERSGERTTWRNGYLKVLGWGRFHLSTILDDCSHYIIAWKLCTTMKAEDDETLSAIGPRTMVECHARPGAGRVGLRQRHRGRQARAAQ